MAALRAALLCRWAVTSHWAGQWTGGVGWELGWIIGEGRGEEGGCDWEGESAPREEEVAWARAWVPSPLLVITALAIPALAFLTRRTGGTVETEVATTLFCSSVVM